MSRIAFSTSIFFASGALWPLAAIADDARVYEGSVGSAPIVLKLERSEGSVFGDYFYRSKRFDIALNGEAKKTGAQGRVTLQSHITGDRFSLEPSGSGYAGSLTTAKGKTLPVELREVAAAPGNLPADLPEGLDLYEKTRLAGLALTPEKSETIAGRNIRWHVEPVSGQRLFRVESGYGAPVLETLNKRLAQIQWRNVSEYFGCPSMEGGAGVESKEIGAPYISDAYVSVAVNEDWSCAGAAHPDFGIEAHSFDAKTGREIELDDLLKYGRGPVPAKDSDRWYEYRSKTFAPALVALLERLYPKEMAVPKKEDDCDYADAEVWSFPAWRLTEKGLYVGASFARVMRVCDNPEWSVIPWSELKDKP